ncbi:MAG: hypothetical protein WBV94_29630 [Blastocatellia bacterium]
MKPQIELTDEEKAARAAISERAIALIQEWDRPIILSFDITATIALIGQLQLAFRHPANVGLSRQMIEKTTRELIEQIDPVKGDVYQFLSMGFDERFDE